MTNVVGLGAARHDLADLVEAITEVLMSRPGRPINFVEAIGALETVKLDLYRQQVNKVLG